MKATIIVPTHLSEITLKQYQRFLKIQEMNDDNYFIQCKMIEIFCNISHKDVLTIKMSDAEMITKKLSDLLSQKPKLVDSFYIGNLEFGFHPDIEDMTLGEYIDLDTYIGDWQNIHTAMNVLYRPIKERKKNKYSIKGYTPEDKDIMVHMPLDAVIGSVFFFIEFRDRLVNNYESLFTGGNQETTSARSGFGQRWGWYQSVYGLANGDITKFENITKLKMHECLLMLTFMKEKNEVEIQQIKSKQRK